MWHLNIIFVIFFFVISRKQINCDLFPLSIIHLNDMHAKYEETNLQANTCKDLNECIGGYARIVTMIKQLRSSQPNPLYLNAGDYFQGTLWYIMFKWNVTQHFLNLEPADVMTLGNHEFDHGVEGIVPFLESIKSSVVVCNINDTLEPTFQEKYKKSIILEKYGRQIGVVGVTTIVKSGNWGNLNILPEVESVRKEVENLIEQGIKIIIVLSHSGLNVDREIAKHGGPIDLIVGGHSHSFLYTGTPVVGPDSPVSDYPTIETQENGRKVLIVQASAYNKYLGNITLYFDDDGEIKSYEGAPIFLSHDIEQDADILAQMQPWKNEVDKYQTKKIGEIKFTLDHSCRNKECGMGNFLTDAMVHAVLNAADSAGEWTGSSLAMLNGRGVRSGLTKGDVIYSDIVSVIPFENVYHLVELYGSTIKEALEFSVSNTTSLNIMQVSGIRVIYDLKRDAYDRIVDLKVLCQACLIPRYENIDYLKNYRVIMPGYVAQGGDGFTMITKGKTLKVFGTRDVDVVADYIEKMSPISTPPVRNRIKFL